MNKDDFINDSRIEKILSLIMEFASGNLEAKAKQSNNNDEIDGIIGGLNMLGEELRASTISRDFLSSIIKTMINGLIIADTNLIILEVNPALELLLGYKAEEIIGKPIVEIYGGNNPLFEHLLEKLPEKGYLAGCETDCLSRENIKIPVSVSISAIHNHENQIENFIFVIHDISELKHREDELRASEQKFMRLFMDVPVSLGVADKKGVITYFNKKFTEVFGYTIADVSTLDEWWLKAYPNEIYRRRALDNWNEVVAKAVKEKTDIKSAEYNVTCKNGVERIVIIGGRPFGGGVLAIFSDITERKRAEEELRITAVTFETHEGILITDAEAKIIRVNHAFQDITGYTSEEVIGKNPSIMSSGRQNKVFYTEMWKQLINTGSWGGEIWDKRKNGQIYPKWLTITAVKNKEQKTTQYVGIFNDISVRKKAEEEIQNLAFYDALTNVPNRRLLLDRFQLAISLSARSNQYGAALYLDMDKFKNLNDIMGHEYGDILLVEVARRIQACLRDADTVARLGGDEFVVLIEEVSGDQKQALQKVALIAEKIREALTIPYLLGEYEYYSSASIGICLYCGNEKSVVDLLKSADMAMYQAKESGRNAIRFFDPLMQQAVENHATLESNLRAAVTNRQLQLHYQIQVDKECRPLGAEALLRWEDPKLGFISPSQFIHIAEESALILDIGHWVIETACRQLAEWGASEPMRRLTLSINVSARQFGLPNFVDSITAAVNTYQIDPSRLKLELTEHVLLNDVINVVTKMNALKDLGVWLSIDDFGTGYSSLSYLKQLPIHELKIDQSFVRDIVTDPNDAMMVKTIISLAQNFHLDVIAEGVETEAQMNFLVQNGCMAYQGYLFGRPVPIEEFEELILSMTN
jgi:diguanylate cyclase (GGDEF)-like protein/PAS domain S-box-containing protein